MSSMNRWYFISAGVVMALVAVRFALPAASAPVTPTANQRLMVYGGVATVSPGGPGDNQFELGNNGRDLVSSGNIVIRPDRTISTPSTTRFIGNADGTRSLSVSGDVRLLTDGRRVCLQGDCRTSWAGGGSYWSDRSEGSSWWLEPTDLTQGLRLGTASPLTSTALEATGLFVSNRGGGNAATLTGNVFDVNRLDVYGTLIINGKPAWTQINDGAGSGLDSAWLDGLTARFEHGNRCWGALCLCFQGVPKHALYFNNISNYCLRFFVDYSQ